MNKEYTFENFVINDNNKFAYVAATGPGVKM